MLWDECEIWKMPRLSSPLHLKHLIILYPGERSDKKKKKKYRFDESMKAPTFMLSSKRYFFFFFLFFLKKQILKQEYGCKWFI